MQQSNRKAADRGSIFNYPITKLHNYQFRGYLMEVILKEDVAKLGSRGDVIKVAEGYGRNYLLPKKLAIEATTANRAVIEQMKAAAVRRVAREKGDAEKLAQLLAGVALSFPRQPGKPDQLFGSVTSADIARELEHKSFNIDRRKIHLDEPLKHIGEFSVPIRLHKDVTVRGRGVISKDAVTEEAPAEEAGTEA